MKLKILFTNVNTIFFILIFSVHNVISPGIFRNRLNFTGCFRLLQIVNVSKLPFKGVGLGDLSQ